MLLIYGSVLYVGTGDDLCGQWLGEGVVEKNVQESRRRIWIDAGNQRFGRFTDLNAWLGQRCRSLWDEVRHPEHDQFSVAEMLKHDRPHLMPMPMPFNGTSRSRRACPAPVWCRGGLADRPLAFTLHAERLEFSSFVDNVVAHRAFAAEKTVDRAATSKR